MSLRRKLIRLAYSQPHLRQDLLPLLKEGRVTKELIRLTYDNLGDFGGSQPVRDSWVLEVKGPYEAMQELIPTLKKYGLRFDRQSKSWRLDAVDYVYSSRKSENLWNWARRNQQAGYPVIKRMVDEYNRKALEENEAAGASKTPQEIMREFSRHQRQTSRLEEAGIQIDFEFPSRYSVDEATAWVRGNTFPYKDIMKKYGFRWGSGRKGKGWWIAAAEFAAIQPKWAQDIIRQLPEPEEETAEAVLSAMSLPELKKFMEPIAEEIWYQNEGYDGEYDVSDVLRGLLSDVRRMSPKEQQDFYDRWTSPTRRR